MRTDQTPWHFLLNPAAGRGKALRRWQRILPTLQAALPAMTVAESSAAEGMAALAEAAVRSGKTHLVGVGGDGTHHDIVNGIVRAGGLGSVIYAPLPLGTGNDWVRTLKTPRRITSWLAMLRQRKVMLHKVGKLNYLSGEKIGDIIDPGENYENGTLRTSYFINVAGLAYDAEVVRRSETARYKHPWLYPIFTLLYLKGFAPPTVEIEYEGNSITSAVHTINLGIGRYSGGGMRLVPQADPQADTLALTYAKKLPVWKILLSSWRFYTGSIGGLAEVTTTHARSVTIKAVEGVTALEADGELLGTVPVTASLLDEALRVVVP